MAFTYIQLACNLAQWRNQPDCQVMDMCRHFIAGLTAIFLLSKGEAAGLKFAGVPVSPGATVTASVPLSAGEKAFASDATRNIPDQAIAVVAFPGKFDPNKSWPVLVVFSTTDFKRLNRNDLVDFYRSAALSQGWIVLAGDAREFAPNDTNGWRTAMTLAALDELHRSFPKSRSWPVAVAGFSGGAKRAGLLAPVLFLEGYRICGVYLTGINEDTLSISYRKSKLGRRFLDTPIFISSGTNDRIAPPERARTVAESIKSAGFRRLRFESFQGPHAVKKDHIVEALRWFRGIGF
jgi:hypothetical protein